MYGGRLFTFGCSFTAYKWPTWADLLGQEFEGYYNFGQSGGGNLFIACSIAEAHARYKITSDDTVMVMWTNVTREDRYHTHSWITPGNIYSQETYSDEFVKKFITVKGCYVRDMAQIHLIKCFLEGTGCKFYFMSMVDLDNYDQYEMQKSKEVVDIMTIYGDTGKIFLPSVHRVIFKFNWYKIPLYPAGPTRQDSHPLPTEHLSYINQVLPYYKFSQKTVDFAKDVTLEIQESYKKFNQYDSSDWKNELKNKNIIERF